MVDGIPNSMSLYERDSMEEIIMTTGMQNIRCWVVAMTLAVVMAVTATYGPVALELAGIAVGTPVYACSHSSGTGDC